MNLSKYKCLVCDQCRLRPDSVYWQCENCGHEYPTVRGVPKLLLETNLGEHDRKLRDYFYNGFLGKYYQHVMPFLALPVRPGYWGGWTAYAVIVTALLFLASYAGYFLFSGHWRSPAALDLVLVFIFISVIIFLLRQRYLFYLLLLAIPVKISLASARFKPKESFPEVHAKLIEPLLQRQDRLQVLDVSTGTCNSLYRHGWMKLNADYTGIDLSETMLLRGLDLMKQRQVPMDFVLGDAARLPFDSEVFDVILNYGALNGYTDARKALEEMARVARPGGLVLFFDEQLYEKASWVEKVYFHRVLSSHDVIHRCPVDQIPPSLGDINVRQIYQFYYLCIGYKR
jgi:ubiquinone/menaquinone biosynthesis C-methylase UbiE